MGRPACNPVASKGHGDPCSEMDIRESIMESVRPNKMHPESKLGAAVKKQYIENWEYFGTAASTCESLTRAMEQVTSQLRAVMQRHGLAHMPQELQVPVLLAVAGWEAVVAGGVGCADEPGCVNTGVNSVYQVAQGGRTIYVGITQNLAQRAAYWIEYQ